MSRMRGWVLVAMSMLVNLPSVVGQGTQPLLVVVEADIAFRAEQRLTAISQFECSDQLHSVQLNGLAVRSSYTIRNKEGFSGRTGIIYSLTEAQQLAKCRFWTVSGPDVFHEFLGTLMEARGDGASMDGSEFQKVIRVAQQPAVSGQATYTWHDLYVSYVDGIIFLGESDATLHFQDSSVLQNVLALAKGNDEFLWAGLKHVPAAIRQKFLTVLSAHLGVQMQRADLESENAFRDRYEAAEAMQEAVRTLLFDINEISAWMSYPANGNPMKAGFRIHAKPDSAFSRLMRSTKASSTVPRPQVDHVIVRVDICLLLTGGFETLTQPTFDRLAQSLGVAVFDQDDQDGSKLNLSLALGCTAEAPIVTAALLCPENGVEAEGVQSNLSSYLAQLSAEHGSVVSEVVQRLSPVNTRVDRECLHLELGLASATQTPPDVSEDSANAFIRLEADLGRLRDLPDPKALGSSFGPFFELFRFVMTWRLIPNGMKPFVDRRSVVERSGKPIIDHVLEGGDWSARAVGTTDGEVTVLSATVGRDLYYFYLAESLLAEAAFYKTSGIR